MRPKIYAISVVSCLGTAALLAWALGWSFERVALLAPVIVISAAAVVGLGLIWTRVAWESLQRQRHPVRIVAIGLGAIALLVGLSVLGLKLPRE
jgi:hypothetical protein